MVRHNTGYCETDRIEIYFVMETNVLQYVFLSVTTKQQKLFYQIFLKRFKKTFYFLYVET